VKQYLTTVGFIGGVVTVVCLVTFVPQINAQPRTTTLELVSRTLSPTNYIHNSQ